MLKNIRNSLILCLILSKIGNGQIIDVIPQVRNTGNITSLQFSHDNNLLASINDATNLKIWDIDKNKIILDIILDTLKNYRQINIQFSTKNKHLKINQDRLKDLIIDINLSRIVEDTANLKYQNEGYVPIFKRYTYKIQSRSIISLYDNTAGHLLKVGELKGDYFDFRFTDLVSNDKKIFASNTDGNIYVADLVSKKIKKRLKYDNFSIYSLSISPNGSYLASGGANGRIIIRDTKTYKILKILQGESDYLSSVEFDPKSSQLLWGIRSGYLSRLDLKDSKLKVQNKHITRRNYPIKGIHVGKGYTYVLEGYSTLIRLDGSFNNYLRRKFIKHKDYLILPLLRFFSSKNILDKLGYDMSGKLEAHLYSNTQKVETHKLSRSRAKFRTRMIRFDSNLNFTKRRGGSYDYKTYYFTGSQGNYYKLSLEKGQEVFLGRSKDSLLVFEHNNIIYMYKKGVANKIIPTNQNDVIIFNKDNYYYATKSGLKAVGFKYGTQFFYPEQFDLKYNRPDLVLRSMGFDSTVTRPYYLAYQKRLAKTGFTEDMLSEDFHVPQIKITSQDIPLTTTKQNIQFQVEASDSLEFLDRINVYVNGVSLYGSKGLNLRDKKVKTYTTSLDIPLSKGKNKVEVSVLNQRATESFKESFEIDYKLNRKERQMKPTLHLITVGVSEYKDTKMNLNYASKDGKDLAELFKKRKKVYQEIKHYPLFDKEVNKNNIPSLKEKLKDTDVDDVVIVFISGHGLFDKKLDYYLATYDMDFANPAERGLLYEDLESLLDGILARQKILFIDACHSGEIDKEEVEQVKSQQAVKAENVNFKNFGDRELVQKNIGLQSSFDLMKETFADLRKGTGSTVLSAAGGVEVAIESKEWQNGAFTYCLLSGLKDKKADLDKDGKIMLSELQSYLLKAVPEVTGGVQQPTSRIENLENDFRVW